jgi:hypothetical protein
VVKLNGAWNNPHLYCKVAKFYPKKWGFYPFNGKIGQFGLLTNQIKLILPDVDKEVGKTVPQI